MRKISHHDFHLDHSLLGKNENSPYVGKLLPDQIIGIELKENAFELED